MTLAVLIGYGIIATGSLLLMAALLGVAALLVHMAGTLLLKYMRGTYRLAAIFFYLEQLQKTGRYSFPPPDKDNP